MKLIIPMAGIGKRMRPHTLSNPKPLLKIAGKSIVRRIVEDFTKQNEKKIKEVHFIIGNFEHSVEFDLIKIAKENGVKGYIHFQNEPLGTAHAIYCASEALNEEILVAFADTLIIGNFLITDSDEAIIWTMRVESPENYGVVVTDKDDYIIEFVEKPKEFISNKAIIGIYYFRNGNLLRTYIENLINDNFRTSNEYQLTDVLKNLTRTGLKFKCKQINEWLDCGNKIEFLKSNKRILEIYPNKINRKKYNNCSFVDPVYIGDNVVINNSKIGPYVSIDSNTKIYECVIKDCIIGSNSNLNNSEIMDSIIGNFTNIKGCRGIINLGDYNSYEAF
jgi:glucose-1-phosphate thymidylyltransferase